MEIVNIKLSDIVRNENQPRKNFDEQSIQELSESIAKDGLMQPITVRKVSNDSYTEKVSRDTNTIYEIVQGERRYRAAGLAGLKELPCFIQELSDEDAFHLSVIENIQREQMTAIEEAQAFQRYVELGYKHEEIAEKVSKSRTYVSSRLRLLQLMPEVQDMIAEGKISEGHAKQLLKLRNELPCKPENEKPYKYAQSVFINEFKGKEKISVNDVKYFSESIKQYLIVSILYVFEENTDKNNIAFDTVRELNLSIEDVTRDHLEYAANYEIYHEESKGIILTISDKSEIYNKYGRIEDDIFNYDGDLSDLWRERYLNSATNSMKRTIEKIEEAKQGVIEAYRKAAKMDSTEKGRNACLEEAVRLEKLDTMDFAMEQIDRMVKEKSVT